MERIEARIEDLKQRADDRETMRYPEAFKDDATDVVRHLRGEGFTQKEVSETLENLWVTLARWKESGEEQNTQAESSRFRPVKLIDDT